MLVCIFWQESEAGFPCVWFASGLSSTQALRSSSNFSMRRRKVSKALALAAEPVWERLKDLVLNGLHSPHSKRAYARALDDFLAWYRREPRPPFGRAAVQGWRAELEQRGLAPATINVRLASIRALAREAAENGLLAPEAAMSAASVHSVRRLGIRAGNWLTREQARALLLAPDSRTLKGKRDRAILGLLVGCGLRRSELSALTLDRFQQREGRWVIPDLEGKGGRLRTVPVPAWVKNWVDEWKAAAGLKEGWLFRPVYKGGRLASGRLAERAVWSVVDQYAAQTGLAKLAPHDLRRTCAKLCRAAGGDLEQIQLLLGHASIETTERYLGTRQNLSQAVNDLMGIGFDN